MKHETTGVVIKEFIRLKPQICLFLVDDSSEYMKGQKKNDGTTLSHKEYKYPFLDNKWLRSSMNRIQSKNHII